VKCSTSALSILLLINPAFPDPRDCLRSLAFPEMKSRFNDIEHAATGTCEWLLGHERYTSWAACDRGLLWVKGKPGSGKSTLLKYALDKRPDATDTKHGDDLILSFFFHGRGTELERTPLGLFRSLLHQVLGATPSALPDLIDTFEKRRKDMGEPGQKWQWHPNELWRFFETSLPRVLETRSVWLFVDALDECAKEDAIQLIRKFKLLLESLPSPSRGLKQFHICFACRHYPVLDGDCGFELCAEDGNKEDISTYVHRQLPQAMATTSSWIISRASNVFLWARLVVDIALNLRLEGQTQAEIQEEMQRIPGELDDLYRDIVDKMKGKGTSSSSLKLIQWICFARRPLSLDELRWSMAVDPDCPPPSIRECERKRDYVSDNETMTRRIRTLSCGLAEVMSDTRVVVQFIHQSVKDFFVKEGLIILVEKELSMAKKGPSAPNTCSGLITDMVRYAHSRLSRICLRYMAMEEIMSTRYFKLDQVSKFPFLEYATTSWVLHTKQGDAIGVPQEDLLELFAWPSNALVTLLTRVDKVINPFGRDSPSEGANLVHISSRYGLLGLLMAVLQREGETAADIEETDANGRMPLCWAALGGHEAVVQLLLEKGANIEVADSDGRAPLWYAAFRGHKAVVQLLLEKGANIEVADSNSRTRLCWAALRGHEAVVQLLLEKGANIEVADSNSRTRLCWAALRGYEAVVQLLLEKGANIEAADSDGKTLLLQAVSAGNMAIVQLLLEKGANTEAVDSDSKTPLWYAAMQGNKAVEQLLLEKGAKTPEQGLYSVLWVLPAPRLRTRR